jgi:hypothetical protein
MLERMYLIPRAKMVSEPTKAKQKKIMILMEV